MIDLAERLRAIKVAADSVLAPVVTLDADLRARRALYDLTGGDLGEAAAEIERLRDAARPLVRRYYEATAGARGATLAVLVSVKDMRALAEALARNDAVDPGPDNGPAEIHARADADISDDKRADDVGV